jgi:hypothetical protein
MRAIGSGGGHILDLDGKVVLGLGEEVVPHGQEARVATFIADEPAPQMAIRYLGHHPDVLIVANDGRILSRFKLNSSPNETGMEIVYWNGPDRPALLYNGGALFDGHGRQAVLLPDLPEPIGPARMGWYHCIPANICGDEREEIVVYNPWAGEVFIYTPEPLDEGTYRGYRGEERQYNARLMD